MANKKDHTLLWIAALGIGGYLYYKHTQGGLLLPGGSTVPNSGGVLLQLPSPATTSPAPSASAPGSNLPSGNIPSSAPSAVAVNVTNLVPAAVTHTGQVVLDKGQTLALHANGAPVINSNGHPMVFPAANPPRFAVPNAQASLEQMYIQQSGMTPQSNDAYQPQKFAIMGGDFGECL